MNNLAEQLYHSSLAPSTLQSYTASFHRYQLFCSQASLSTFPVIEHNLILFCTYLSNHVAASTIKSYLSGIRFHAIALGFPFDVAAMPRLYYILRGIKRTQGNRHQLPLRKPITMLHLTAILSWLQHSSISTNDRCLWWSACTLAFFGLLRVSEYTAPTSYSITDGVTFSTNDVQISPDLSAMIIFIKASKTDPFKSGCSLRISSTNNRFCPVNALQVYLHSRSQSLVCPMFVFSDGSFLTRQRITSFLSNVLHETNLNTHSFRIGGATALAAAGFSDALIQVIGRWSSDCFKKYIRLSPNTLRSYPSAMCLADSGATCWNPN